MSPVLAFLGRHAPWFLFAGVFVGLAVPPLAALLRPLLAPCVTFVLLLVLLRVDWRATYGYARRPWLAVALIGWVLLAAPVVVWLALRVVPVPEALGAAVVLMAAAPPLLAAAGIVAILGLEGPLALATALVATLLAPLTIPPLALALLGLELEIGLGAFMLRLAAVIAVAAAGALVVRRLAPAGWLPARAPQIDGLFVVVMVVFAIGIMDGVTRTALARPETVALWLAAAFLANPLLQALGALVFGWLGRSGALTVGLLSGNRNMGLVLAALPADAAPDVVLFFALAQLPMYMLPALQMALYRRALVRRR